MFVKHYPPLAQITIHISEWLYQIAITKPVLYQLIKAKVYEITVNVLLVWNHGSAPWALLCANGSKIWDVAGGSKCIPLKAISLALPHKLTDISALMHLFKDRSFLSVELGKSIFQMYGDFLHDRPCCQKWSRKLADTNFGYQLFPQVIQQWKKKAIYIKQTWQGLWLTLVIITTHCCIKQSD